MNINVYFGCITISSYLSSGCSRLSSESHLVESHYHCSPQAEVVLQSEPRPGHLTTVSLTSHLAAQLIALGQSSGSQRVALADQTSAGVDDISEHCLGNGSS